MKRSKMRELARRRLDDNLSNSGQLIADDPLNDEIDEATMDVAGEIELEGWMWRLAARKVITLAPPCQQYRINPDCMIHRLLVRTDVTPPIVCNKIDRLNLENAALAYGNPRMRATGSPSEGYAGETFTPSVYGGIDYTIGPDDQGYPAILIPYAPTVAAVLTQHYMRAPKLMKSDDDEPFDIPVMLHRLVPLKAAMNVLGTDQDGGGAYQALAAEYADVKTRGIRLLRRKYEPQFVEDVAEW